MKNLIATSKKENKFGYFERVTDIISCDGEFIEYNVQEFTYLRNNQGNSKKGWKSLKRSMLIEDFHNYFNVLNYDFLA